MGSEIPAPALLAIVLLWLQFLRQTGRFLLMITAVIFVDIEKLLVKKSLLLILPSYFVQFIFLSFKKKIFTFFHQCDLRHTLR